MTVIAGIDPSMTPGLCIMDGDKIIHVEQCRSLRPKTVKGEETNYGEFYANFADWALSFITSHRVEMIAYELPVPKGQVVSKASAHDTATMMKGRIEEICFRLSIDFVGVHIQSWRSFFLGKTKAPKAPEAPAHILPHRKDAWQTGWRKDWWKDEAIRRCAAIGLELKSHDAAEACGVAAWLHGQLNPGSWLKANDLFSGEMTRKQGTLGLAHQPLKTPQPPITKADVKAHAESFFKPINP